MATAIALPDYDHAPEPECSECDSYRRELAKARKLLADIERIEVKTAKRENIEDDPRDSEILGYETTLATIKTKCRLFLKYARRSVSCE